MPRGGGSDSRRKAVPFFLVQSKLRGRQRNVAQVVGAGHVHAHCIGIFPCLVDIPALLACSSLLVGDADILLCSSLLQT